LLFQHVTSWNNCVAERFWADIIKPTETPGLMMLYVSVDIANIVEEGTVFELETKFTVLFCFWKLLNVQLVVCNIIRDCWSDLVCVAWRFESLSTSLYDGPNMIGLVGDSIVLKCEVSIEKEFSALFMTKTFIETFERKTSQAQRAKIGLDKFWLDKCALNEIAVKQQLVLG